MTRGVPTTVTAMLVLAATLGGSEAVRANGGTLRVARAQAGPYLVSVWTQPDPPRVGRLDVSVAVMRPQDGTAILDVATSVVAEPADAPGPIAKTQATRGGGGNPFLYHAELELPQPGRWRVTVTVQAPPGQGRAAFEIIASPGSRLVPLLVAAGTGLLLVGMLWWRVARRAKPAPAVRP
ncbi:MAG: hypothetical protein ACREKS_12540 [Candidatus Rokuibacteriota bacterium]